MQVIYSTINQEIYNSCHLGLDLLCFTSLQHINVVFPTVLHVGVLVLAYLEAHKNKVTLGAGSLEYTAERRSTSGL